MTGNRSESERPGPPVVPASDRGVTPVGEWAAGLSQRRQRALDEVAGELGPAQRGAGQPAVALRDYGPGCVCLGIAGPVDRAMAERLQGLLGELRSRGRHELTITVTGLGPWHPHLARVLAHARIQHLVDGAHVELHDLPETLAVELRAGSPTAFLVLDTTPTDPPAVPRTPDRRRSRPPSARLATPQDGTRP